MITIFLQNGQLDLYDTDVSISWDNIRFSDGLRDAYSNDFDIPKTQNNIRLLNVYGLLDNNNISNHIKPCIMSVNGAPHTVHIQIVSVTNDTIKICVFEDSIPNEFFDKGIRDILKDDQYSIFAWDCNSIHNYPLDFVKYCYGETYNENYAQIHPSKPLANIFTAINDVSEYQLPMTSGYFPTYGYIVATKKNVCPQNTKQSIEFVLRPMDDDTTEFERCTMKLIGGQHITNDVAGYTTEETNVKKITFNRSCHVNIDKIYLSWLCPTAYGQYRIRLYKNDEVIYYFPINVASGTKDGVNSWGNIGFTVEAGDTIYINVPNSVPFTKCAALMNCTLSYYDINDDDYETELTYCKRTAKLPIYQYYSDNQRFEIPAYFDGRSYTYNTDSSGQQTATLTTTYNSLSYYGYYTNLDNDVKIKDILYSLCWYENCKIQYNENGLVFVQNDYSGAIDGVINSISPNTDKIGQLNYIKYNGEGNPTSILNIDNVFLNDSVTIHESCFSYVENSNGYGKINQYKWNSNNDGYDFNEVEGLSLMIYNDESYLEPPEDLQTMEINKLIYIMEVEIETYDTLLSNLDFVYLDGRKYMVINGAYDCSTKKTTLTTLLCSTSPNDITNIIQR